MSPRNPKSETVDLEALAADFRAGMLTKTEIAAKYGISGITLWKWEKKYGWERDLSAKVREAVRIQTAKNAASLAKPDKPASKPIPEEKIIEAAAQRGARANMSHLEMTERLKKIAIQLSDLIDDAMGEDKAKKATAIAKLCIQKSDGLTSAIRTLADTIEKVQRLERRALNLDDDSKPPPATPPDLMTEQQRFERALIILQKAQAAGKR